MQVTIYESDENDANEKSSVTGTEIVVKCKCGNELGILLISQTKLPQRAFNCVKKKFYCPCGDSSFVYKSETETYFIPNDKYDYGSFGMEGECAIARLKDKP